MIYTNEILEFIHRRFPQDCNWLNGNCLWFAIILQTRFPSMELYYLPIEGHFVTKWRDKYFDWSGIITPTETPISWAEVQQDSLWYKNLMRDCFN